VYFSEARLGIVYFVVMRVCVRGKVSGLCDAVGGVGGAYAYCRWACLEEKRGLA